MTTALIICGALAREVLDMVQKHGWDAEVFGIPAIDHLFPERIAPDVEKRFLEIKARFERTIVVFGDCGSRGALDEMLARHGLERLDGPHCYEMYGGQLFHDLMEEEPGTFFLTDFLVRGFNGTVMKGLGLDRFPELKEEYFRHYRRLVYLVQNEESELAAKSRQISEYLGLPLEIRVTGYGLLEDRLVEMMV
ncbi:MAG TPA: DUF1638 domain-containing protein [Chloroflexota bacterium]|nr:DUF1638 domain-containing protein [Chloroflexota bacterium]HUM69646.1 DUF1638 domain-containing protein [Chloroflexota bacterium]